MSGVATAIAGAAVIGAVASSKASKSAAKASGEASDTAAAETRRATAEARKDLFKLFPAAQQNAQQGFQGAADVFGQSLPAQAQAFQQGNVGAQQALLAGLPQFQNAILGNAVDFSQLQPVQQQQPDLSFFQQQLPQAFDPFSPNQGQMGPFPPSSGVGIGPDVGIANFLGGNRFNNLDF